MCHFVTATLAADSDVDAVRKLARDHLLRWDDLINGHVLGQLIEGEKYFFTTWGMCDCGTAIGACAGDIEPDEPSDYTREIKRFRKKSWTQAKIDRWIEQQEEERQRRRREAGLRRTEPSVEIDRWRNFLLTVIDQHLASHVGVLLHWYSGGLENERIRLGERRWVSLGQADEDYLKYAEEDVIHAFTV